MALKTEMHGEVAVIVLKGKLMGGPDTKILHDTVKDLIEKGKRKIVVDLAGVKWMNSTGLGALMGALTTARNNEADLKLANTTEKVESLFMITKLITVFDTYNSVIEAAASFD